MFAMVLLLQFANCFVHPRRVDHQAEGHWIAEIIAGHVGAWAGFVDDDVHRAVEIVERKHEVLFANHSDRIRPCVPHPIQLPSPVRSQAEMTGGSEEIGFGTPTGEAKVKASASPSSGELESTPIFDSRFAINSFDSSFTRCFR